MAEGFTALNLRQLQTNDGMRELNRMFRDLYDNLAGDTDTVRIFKGFGTPEGTVASGVGSLYQRLDGSTSTTLYVKESGTDNTGWVAK